MLVFSGTVSCHPGTSLHLVFVFDCSMFSLSSEFPMVGQPPKLLEEADKTSRTQVARHTSSCQQQSSKTDHIWGKSVHDHVSIDSKRGADIDPVAAQTHGSCRGP